MQFFKGDEKEIKMYESGRPPFSQVDTQKNLFFALAYFTATLGDVIYEDGRSPLANAIPEEIFRQSFNEIFTSFSSAGTFESYIVVFKKIFGDTVVIDFEVPGPGKLNINIESDGIELADFVARYIFDDEYMFDEVIDDEGDNIVFQGVKGFQSQYELEQMLFEMVPAGIYTEITLEIGA